MAADEPLSDARLFILELSGDDVEERLNVEESLLIDLLLEEGVLTPPEGDTLRSIPMKKGQEKEHEKTVTRKLLTMLQKKTNARYDKFIQILKKSDQSHIAEHYFSDKVIDKAVKDLQEALSEHYRGTYVDDMFTLHGAGHKVNLEDIYVPITWAKFANTPGEMHKSIFADYQQMFDQNQIKPRIIITGEASGGKTTFIKKVCFDWAMHKAPCSTHEQTALEQFKVVLPITLGTINKDDTFSETLNSQLGFLTSKQMQTMKWLLKKEPKSVLLLFDGFDEYDLSRSKEITSILEGVMHRTVIVAMTTRPELQDVYKTWRIEYQLYELSGFDGKLIIRYIELYFNKVANGKQLAKELISKIFPDWDELRMQEKYDVMKLQSICTSPGSLSILCTIWKESHGKFLTSNKMDLYEQLVFCMLSRYEQKSRLDHFRTPKHKLRERYHDVLLRFGQLASLRDGLLMKTAFTVEEVADIVGDDAMQYGFLYQTQSTTRLQDNLVIFLHRTVQEYLAAYMINEQCKINKHVVFCDLVPRCCRLQDLQREATLVQFLIDCFFDDQTCSDFMENVLKLNIQTSLGDPNMSDMHVFKYLAYHQLMLSMLPKHLPIHRRYTRDIWIEMEQFDRTVLYKHALCTLMTGKGNKEKLRVIPGSDKLPNMLTFHSFPDLDFLFIASYASQISSFPPEESLGPTAFLLCGKKVDTVHVRGDCGGIRLIQVSDVLRVEVPSGMKSLQAVNIFESDISGTGAVETFFLSSLIINLISCKLTADDLRFAQTLRGKIDSPGFQMSRLHTLTVVNSDLSGAGSHIGYLLSYCPSLTKANFMDNNLGATDIKGMRTTINSLSNQSPLQDLHLSRNNIQGSLVDLMLMCANFKALTSLDAEYCRINDDDLQALIDICDDEGSADHISFTPNTNLSYNLCSNGELIVLLAKHLPSTVKSFSLYSNMFDNPNEITSKLDEDIRKVIRLSRVDDDHMLDVRWRYRNAVIHPLHFGISLGWVPT